MVNAKNILQHLLKGKDPAARMELDAYFETIPDNPYILWYPSAGYDFRDISELSGERAVQHGFSILPDIYLHNDCSCGLIDKEPGEIENDGYTSMTLNEKHELVLNPNEPVTYFVNPEYTNFRMFVQKDPRIQLLDISWTSHLFGTARHKVIYFYFENNNFLDQVILRYKLPISHLVKIREGFNEGGVKMSVSYVLDMLSALNTKYLLFGDGIFIGIHDIETDLAFLDLKRKVIKDHGLQLVHFQLDRINQVHNWCNDKVDIYEVSYIDEPVTDDDLWAHLKPFLKFEFWRT